MKELGKPKSDSDVVNAEPRVLLIGYGWVGQFMGKYFTKADIFTSEGYQRKQYDHYDLAIIGVPTPMQPQTGKCDTLIVEEMVKQFTNIVDIFLVKSTVEIGTCDRLSKTYHTPVCMSPEYVGETLGHKLVEPRKDAFQIIGGPKEAREKVAQCFMSVLHADAHIMLCEAKEAELIKYSENYWITQRVAYWNDVAAMCKALGVSFQTVRNGITLDPRMNRTHSNVYPNNKGWSGKCLPKDMNALAYTMRELGSPLLTLEALIEINAQVRSEYNNANTLIPTAPVWREGNKTEAKPKESLQHVRV